MWRIELCGDTSGSASQLENHVYWKNKINN
jgi:hypothetical protein